MNLDVKCTFNIGNKGFNFIRSIRKDINFMMGCVCSTDRAIMNVIIKQQVKIRYNYLAFAPLKNAQLLKDIKTPSCLCQKIK